MKNYCSIKTFLNAMEAVGVIVLFLVLGAVAGMKLSWSAYPIAVYAGFVILVSSIVISLCSSLFRLSGLWSDDRFLVLWGIVLLVVGGSAIVLLPEFFHIMKDIPYSYWHRVSVYSMPAICIEGGLFTLFRAYTVYRQKVCTIREQGLLLAGFSVYAVLAVAVNFLAIGAVLSVETQLLFSRIIVGVALIMTVTLFFYRRVAVRKNT